MQGRHYLPVFLCLIGLIGCARGTEQGSQEEITIRAVSYNIYHDRDEWPPRLAVIADTMQVLAPDIICLQEVLQHESLPNQAEALAERLGYNFYFISADDTDQIRRYGNAVLSPHSFDEMSKTRLVPTDDYRTAGHVRITIDGREVDVFCTHLHHMPTEDGAAIRSSQIGDLRRFIDQNATSDVVILGGDFNAEPHYEEMAAVSERFLDTYEAVYGESERPTTLNPHHGHDHRWIDYVFVGREGNVRIDAVRRVLAQPVGDTLWASDHFAVMADITVTGSGGTRELGE